MSESSGFFISQGGDRKYSPAWLASYIKALVTTGVYKDELAVTAGDGMAISLSYGRAWLEGYLYLNDAPMTMAIGNADSVLGRKDNVVVRLNLTDRTIRAMVLPGTFSASPVAPVPTRTADVFDLKLAEINVPAGTTKITQDLILDTRLDDAVCGLTVCTVQHIPTATFLAQMTTEFETWFEDVKDQLDEDVAGHLLQMIREMQSAVDELTKAADAAETAAQAAQSTANTVKTEVDEALKRLSSEDTSIKASITNLSNTLTANINQRAKIVYGSYVGTGTCGFVGRNSINFASALGVAPKLLAVYPGENIAGTHFVVINGAHTAMTQFLSNKTCNFYWEGTTVLWNGDTADYQLNRQGATYYYVAIA